MVETAGRLPMRRTLAIGLGVIVSSGFAFAAVHQRRAASRHRPKQHKLEPFSPAAHRSHHNCS